MSVRRLRKYVKVHDCQVHDDGLPFECWTKARVCIAEEEKNEAGKAVEEKYVEGYCYDFRERISGGFADFLVRTRRARWKLRLHNGALRELRNEIVLLNSRWPLHARLVNEKEIIRYLDSAN